MKKLTATALLGLTILSALSGCTTEWARRSADAQVYEILRDRKARTLGYTPQVVVGPADAPDAPEPQPAVPQRAYDFIPATPLPPPETPPPLENAAVPLPAGPLGPRLQDLPALPALPPDEAGKPRASGGPGAAGAGTSLTPTASGPRVGDFRMPMTEHVPAPTVTRLEYGPPAPRGPLISLDLFASIAYAVQHAPTYRDQMDNLYLAALDVTLQRHLFEPRPFTRVGLAFTGGQADASYQSALTATVDAGVRQRLPYGGEIVAEALVNFVHTLDGAVADGEPATIALSGSIPLLRGAGLVNLEPLIASERTLIYQVRSFEDYRRSFTIQVADNYFRLLTQLQAVENRRVNVANLSLLLDRARDLYERGPKNLPGRLNYLEVQRSEQALLDGQDQLLSAQQTYLNQIDNFKILLGMKVTRELEVVPVQLEVRLPDLVNGDSLTLANRFRLDLQTARDRVDDARRQTEVAANGLLPDLDLTAGGVLGNRTSDAARNLDSRNLTYSAGITLDLPLDRLAERNVYRQSLIAFHRAQRNFALAEDQVAADVRAAVRAIRQAQSSVEIERRGIAVAERRLEYAYILLQQGGQINARDVVEAQQSLLSAQDAYEQARADLQIQVLQYLRNTGTLRVDPSAGTLGRALDRAAVIDANRAGRSRVPADPSLRADGANELADPK